MAFLYFWTKVHLFFSMSTVSCDTVVFMLFTSCGYVIGLCCQFDLLFTCCGLLVTHPPNGSSVSTIVCNNLLFFIVILLFGLPKLTVSELCSVKWELQVIEKLIDDLLHHQSLLQSQLAVTPAGFTIVPCLDLYFMK